MSGEQETIGLFMGKAYASRAWRASLPMLAGSVGADAGLAHSARYGSGNVVAAGICRLTRTNRSEILRLIRPEFMPT